MIYTITPNPALDLSGHVSKVLPNEKNYVFRERRDPGGNGINVARIVKRMGASVTALGFIGGGSGEEVSTLLSKEGVAHDFTIIQSSTRTNVTITNDSDHRQTRLTFPGPKVTKSDVSKLSKKIRRLNAPGIVVFGGSAPKGCADDFYCHLGRITTAKAMPVIIDTPVKFLRKCLRDESFRPLLIKPNLTEFEELLGRKFRTNQTLAKEAMKLTDRAAIVCISLGKQGAIFATRKNVWFGKSAPIKARGTVGSGDSMVGAMAARLAKYIGVASDVETIREKYLLDVFSWGLAAGAASAEAEGTAMAPFRRMQELRKSVRVSSL